MPLCLTVCGWEFKTTCSTWLMPFQMWFLSDTVRYCYCSFEEWLCNSSVRTQNSLPENFIFYFVSAISVPTVVAAEGYIFILQPGQLQSDTTRVQIVHSFQTRVRFAVILLALCALWIRRWNGADSGGKWNAIFGVESGRSSVLENQYLCFSHSAIYRQKIKGGERRSVVHSVSVST